MRQASPPLIHPPSVLGRILAALLSTSDRTCPTSPSFTLCAFASSDPASLCLSFFNPFCRVHPPPLHFLRPLNFPALPLSLSLSFLVSLALSLSSFHAMLGLPKRLGLNGENLLWYNELGIGEGRNKGGRVERRGVGLREGGGVKVEGKMVGCRCKQGWKGVHKKLNKWLHLFDFASVVSLLTPLPLKKKKN